MKTALAFIGGAVIVTGIDIALGIDFKNVNAVAELIHKTSYMFWGIAVVKMS